MNELWWKSGVIYQIYPRSFMDSNNDGIGDLQGIISKLDYLKTLGVNGVWISPVYPSPMKDFGYDIFNYTGIDPIFGDIEIFKQLLEEAHKRNIKIIMDLVINHTSDQHPWFLESRSSKDNPKRDWYIWHPGANGKVPNNWICQFEMRSAWFMDSITNEYYLGTFTRNQPELNWRNADLQKQVYSEIDFWLQMGVDGFRMDVANWYVKDDKFRSNPWSLKKGFLNFFQKHIYDRNRPETHQICKEIRKLTDKYPERMLVGEIFSRDISKSVDYYGNDDELHLAFYFDFLFQKWGAKNFRDSAIKFYNSLGEKGWPNFTLSNHDQPRHYYRYKKGNKTKDRAKVAAAMLLTLKGTPFIYYGEEIGMTNGKIRGKDIQDPLGKSISFLGRDGERTPMQWDSSLNSGFSKTKPWLPVNPDYIWKNTVVQQRDPNSLLNFYVKMINLRNSRNSLKHGDIYFIDNDAKDYMAYQRFIENEITLIIINFSGSKVKAKIDAESYKTIIFNNYERTHFDNFNNLELAPYEIIILEVS